MRVTPDVARSGSPVVRRGGVVGTFLFFAVLGAGCGGSVIEPVDAGDASGDSPKESAVDSVSVSEALSETEAETPCDAPSDLCCCQGDVVDFVQCNSAGPTCRAGYSLY